MLFSPRFRTSGFTLIELLVAITVIGVLIAIIAPSLDKAREAGLRTASLSNAHQVGLAGTSYQRDNKDAFPFTNVYQRGGVAGADSGPLEGGGFCPWSFVGRNNAAAWSGRTFDVEAADRPLNSYVAAGVSFEAPAAPASIGPSESDRACAEIPVVRVRGFEDSLERSWPGEPMPSANPGVSCYQDVGTSYLLNLRLLDAQLSIADPVVRLRAVLPALATADSKTAWFSDQAGEAVPRSSNAGFEWENAFDDVNRSVMGFVDGHSLYVRVKPGVMFDKDYSLTLTWR